MKPQTHSLKKLLRRRSRQLLNEVFGQFADLVGLYDLDGQLFLGSDPESAQPGGKLKYPVSLNGERVGWVASASNGEAIASLVNYALEAEFDKKDLVRDSLEKYKELSLLYRLAENMAQRLDVDEIADFVLKEAKSVLKFTDGCLLLLRGDNEFMNVVTAVGDVYDTKEEVWPTSGLAGWVFKTGQAEIVNDVKSDDRVVNKSVSLNAVISAPLKTKTRTLGVIQLGTTNGETYDSLDLKLLDTIALQTSSAIENAIFHQQKVSQERIKTHLQRYVSPQLVQAIMESDEDNAFRPVAKTIVSLFADIRDFTTICERLKPEEIVEYLSEYYTHMVHIIFDHGGTVDKFVGDMIVAMFGAPFDLEDQERLAIRTAIAMQERVREFPNPWIRENFKIGIGLNVGKAVIGNVGATHHMDYTAIGDSVNTAARLQSMAKAGEILVTKSIFQHTHDEFAFHELGPAKVKGKSDSVEVFKVTY